ncbi:hypothetical protein ACF044_11450 [Microbacterium sp. NPDC016588]
MTDYFSQSVRFALPDGRDPWRIAADLLDVMEAGFGSVWNPSAVEFRATSATQITFAATDLTTLHEKVDGYGGKMRDIVVDADLHLSEGYLSATAWVWPQAGDTTRGELRWRMPTRVDTERFQVNCERMLTAYKRRNRWKSGTWTFDSVSHRSDAETSTSPSVRPVLTLSRGKWMARRWFVRNRDNLIISLGGGLVVSLIVIGLQIAGVLAVP